MKKIKVKTPPTRSLGGSDSQKGKESRILAVQPLFSDRDRRTKIPLPEVARATGLPQKWLYGYAKNGVIPGARQAGRYGRWTFERELLERWWQVYQAPKPGEEKWMGLAISEAAADKPILYRKNSRYGWRWFLFDHKAQVNVSLGLSDSEPKEKVIAEALECARAFGSQKVKISWQDLQGGLLKK